jgi:DNA-damage-inducible protein J
VVVVIYGLNGELANYRSLICKNYIIVYRVRENIEGMRMNDETIVRIRRFKVATIKINMDDDIKRAADNLFSELGLDTSTAVKIFISAALEEEGLPFRVKKHRYNAETLEAINDVRLHRNLKGPFNTAGEAMKAMLED